MINPETLIKTPHLMICDVYKTPCLVRYGLTCFPRMIAQSLVKELRRLPQDDPQRKSIIKQVNGLGEERCQLGKALGRNIREQEPTLTELILLDPSTPSC